MNFKEGTYLKDSDGFYRKILGAAGEIRFSSYRWSVGGWDKRGTDGLRDEDRQEGNGSVKALIAWGWTEVTRLEATGQKEVWAPGEGEEVHHFDIHNGAVSTNIFGWDGLEYDKKIRDTVGIHKTLEDAQAAGEKALEVIRGLK